MAITLVETIEALTRLRAVRNLSLMAVETPRELVEVRTQMVKGFPTSAALANDKTASLDGGGDLPTSIGDGNHLPSTTGSFVYIEIGIYRGKMQTFI